jgi:hypothetical protein
MRADKEKGEHAHIGAAVGDHTVEDGEQQGKGTQPSEQQESFKDGQVHNTPRCNSCRNYGRPAPAHVRAVFGHLAQPPRALECSACSGL